MEGRGKGVTRAASIYVLDGGSRWMQMLMVSMHVVVGGGGGNGGARVFACRMPSTDLVTSPLVSEVNSRRLTFLFSSHLSITHTGAEGRGPAARQRAGGAPADRAGVQGTCVRTCTGVCSFDVRWPAPVGGHENGGLSGGLMRLPEGLGVCIDRAGVPANHA